MKMSAVQKTQNSELMFEAYSAACDWFGLTKKEQAKILGVGRNTLHRNNNIHIIRYPSARDTAGINLAIDNPEVIKSNEQLQKRKVMMQINESINQ
jgi:hypothetical protein